LPVLENDSFAATPGAFCEYCAYTAICDASFGDVFSRLESETSGEGGE